MGGWLRRALVKLKRLAYTDYILSVAEAKLRPAKTDILLDIGGGGAYYAQRLATKVKAAILIDDFAGAYARHFTPAKSAAACGNIAIVIGDAERIPIRSAAADKILSNQLLEHLRDPEGLFREASHALSLGGRMVVMSQNADFLARYAFPVRRWARRLVPSAWIGGSPFLSLGYEGWERSVGHLHRFTARGYRDMAERAGLEVEEIYSIHGRASFAVWEIETSLSGSPRWSYAARAVCRAVLLPVCRRLERALGGEGVDLVGVFRKPSRASPATTGGDLPAGRRGGVVGLGRADGPGYIEGPGRRFPPPGRRGADLEAPGGRTPNDSGLSMRHLILAANATAGHGGQALNLGRMIEGPARGFDLTVLGEGRL
jgi:SAM-dependent methyltransferase